jgi:hypothetical protein
MLANALVFSRFQSSYFQKILRSGVMRSLPSPAEEAFFTPNKKPPCGVLLQGGRFTFTA